MIKEFMRIGGAKTKKEFYEMYPTEEAFFIKHGGAISKLMARGGEAYPQTATMDNFFSYGVPVPPTYYAHGGAFPMAQPEEQFFSPFYGNVPNPYNKAMGGSSEAYPQSMSFPYGNTGRSTHFMMADGGDMPEEQTLPKMGVNGKLLEFVGTVKNTAANKLNSNLRNYGKVKNPEQYEFEQAKWGGNLKEYQTKDTPGGINNIDLDAKKGPLFEKIDLPKVDVNSDKGTTNNYYYGPGPQGYGSPSFTNCFPGDPNCNQAYGQLPPEYYNNTDYMYRRRPLSDFNIRGRGIFGNYRATGTLEDEYGLEGLRQMGLRDVTYNTPKWYQFLKRPSTTYHFDPYGQQSTAAAPGQQGPAASTTTGTGTTTGGTGTTGTTPQASGTGVTADKQTPANQADPGKGMGFFGRLFNREGNIVPQPGSTTNVVPDQQVEGKERVSERNYQMWNPEFTDWRNQSMQNKLRRQGKKLDELEAFKAWQQDQLGNENIELSGWRGRQQRRIDKRRGRIEDKMNDYKGFVDPNMPTEKFGGQQEYQAKDTQGTVKTPSGREVPLNDHKRGEKTTFKGTMTVDEYLKRKEMSEGLKQQIIDSNDPNIQWTPMQGVVDRQQIGNQPVGGTTIIMPPKKDRVLSPMEQLYLDALKAESARAGVTNPQNISEADMQRIMEMTPSYTTGPEGFAYGGYTTYAKGGSYNAGDVVDMTPEELQRFIAMGGQVEFLD